MIRALAVVAFLALASAACAQPAGAPSFSYDQTQPMPPIETGPPGAPAPGVKAYSIAFLSDGRRTTGEVVEGVGAGPHPAVLFVHWLGDIKTTNHTEFEPDAIALAKLGVTSLLVDAPWTDPKWFDPLGVSADADLASSRNEVIDLRRALDVLQGLPGVDRGRIAYVGHDFGAMFGILLASVDKRPKWYVFMTPNTSFGEWYLWGKKKPDRDAYLAKLAVLDLVPYAKTIEAKAIYMQFSGKDEFVTAAHADALIDAMPGPLSSDRYDDADHSLAIQRADDDRMGFLKGVLLAAP